MTSRQVLGGAAALAITTGGLYLASPPPARALAPVDPPCIAGGGLPGTCSLSSSGGGIVSSATSALTAVTLGAVVTWVVSSAKYVLTSTAQVLSRTTSPQLTSTWFSATYWRVAGIAAVLTLPFLFAAAVQGLIRSDLSLMIRAAFGYLPLALLAVVVAAPMTMLLLAASDQMSAIVSSAAGNQGVDFLEHAAGLLSVIGQSFASPFVLLLVGLLTVGGALMVWVELLVREAAVYVIVLMLPLAFAAFVWPARRVWAIRAIELLVALILSKFVIVAVLSLGGAALDQSVNRSVTGLLAGGVLMALASFAPWAMLRLVPLAELGSAAASSLSAGPRAALLRLQQSDARASQLDDLVLKLAQMRDAAGEAGPPFGDDAGETAAPAGDGTREAGSPADTDVGQAESAPTTTNSAPTTTNSAPTTTNSAAATTDSGPATTNSAAATTDSGPATTDNPRPPLDHGSDGGKPPLDIEQPGPPSDPPAPPPPV